MESSASPDADRKRGNVLQSLQGELSRIGVFATPAQLEALSLYASELLRWNARRSLTGLKTFEAIVREGFLRSLCFRAAFEPAAGLKAVDIGSGAGFPGLVLSICYPEVDMLLVEASRLRAAFLKHLIRQLGLKRARCLRARVEELHGQVEHRATYQIAFARAVGGLPTLIALAEPLLAPGGRLVLLMGRETARLLRMIGPRLAQVNLRAEVCQAQSVAAAAPPMQLLVVEKLP